MSFASLASRLASCRRSWRPSRRLRHRVRDAAARRRTERHRGRRPLPRRAHAADPVGSADRGAVRSAEPVASHRLRRVEADARRRLPADARAARCRSLAAREAVNRLRMDASVLYASIGATDAPAPPRERERKARRRTGSAAVADHRPLSRSRRGRRRGGRSPAVAQQLDALSTIAGQPVAHERADGLGARVPRSPVPAVAARAGRGDRAGDRAAARRAVGAAGLHPPDPARAERSAVREPVALLAWRPAKSAAPTSRTRGTARRAGPACARPCSTPARCSTHPDLADRFVGGYDFVDAVSPRSIRTMATVAIRTRPTRATGVAVSECGPGHPRAEQHAGTARTSPARSAPPRTTASALPASTGSAGSCRCACSANAAARRATSPMRWSGRRAAR